MPDRSPRATTAQIEDVSTFDVRADACGLSDLHVQNLCSELGLERPWLVKLCNACLSEPPFRHRALLHDMLGSGITAKAIAEGYVPAAARLLGERWCSDDSDFGRVTIACSRLHRVLREVSADWRGPEQIDPLAPSVLIAVESSTHHTLGATVLAGTLRRRGLAVRLLVGAEPDIFAEQLLESDYSAVLLSASGRASLEIVRKFVEIVRRAAPLRIPVVIGGPILKDGETTAHEVLSFTGADHCTDDPNEALRLCGLDQIHRVRAARVTASKQRA